LTHFDSSGVYGQWDVGREISHAPDGHFQTASVVRSDGYIYMFGTQTYRNSNVYLARIPSDNGERYPDNNFWSARRPTEYFKAFEPDPSGMLRPTWTGTEADPAVTPVVVDNPAPTLTGLACYQAGPTIGNVSVQYEPRLGLWLMTFDGGRQEERIPGCFDPDHIRGIYFTYAKQPFGPWATPQLIYNAVTDGGFGAYIFNPTSESGPIGGPQGPAISGDDCERGQTYAPFMVSRFNQIDNAAKMLSIYYTMSTGNPYTILLMRSDFTISRGPDK
jgi:hypothetical protein